MLFKTQIVLALALLLAPGIDALSQGTVDSMRESNVGRTEHEINLVFDRNKARTFNLFTAALKANPRLQGSVLLELTIAESGAVTQCRMLSSNLDAPEFENRIVRAVKEFRFPPKQVGSVTVTKRLDFLRADP